MSVRTRYSGSTRDLKYNERYHRVKHQICGNIKMFFIFLLSYSKVRAFFTIIIVTLLIDNYNSFTNKNKIFKRKIMVNIFSKCFKIS